MLRPHRLAVAAASLTLAMAGYPALAADKETEERIRQLEEQLEELKQQVEVTAEAVESKDEEPEAKQVHIGGYGEVHYNNLDADDSDNDLKEIDLHRFVLFFGYDYTDDIRFWSEVEIEHAGVDSKGDPLDGEVAIEQAYIEFDLTDAYSTKGGVYLLPVGILNETHEPNTFYGVERNPVENVIIPTTWREAGAEITGRYGNGLSWNLGLHSGLEVSTSGDNAFRIRSGRNKASNAKADDPAVTGRLKYTGIPGLELAGALQYQSDITQDSGDDTEEAVLAEAHAIASRGPFSLRALYARWDIEGDAVEAANADEQYGWYVEPSVKPWEKLGFYVRYADVRGARDRDRFAQWEGGLNFWPHPSVVLKADYRNRSHDLDKEEGRDFTGFDLGIGYEF